jgi:hypothetical protein
MLVSQEQLPDLEVIKKSSLNENMGGIMLALTVGQQLR